MADRQKDVRDRANGSGTGTDLPDVPNILDLVTSEEDKAALNLIFAPTYIGWPTLMPPNVPQDRVALVRNAYMNALRCN